MEPGSSILKGKEGQNDDLYPENRVGVPLQTIIDGDAADEQKETVSSTGVLKDSPNFIPKTTVFPNLNNVIEIKSYCNHIYEYYFGFQQKTHYNHIKSKNYINKSDFFMNKVKSQISEPNKNNTKKEGINSEKKIYKTIKIPSLFLGMNQVGNKISDHFRNLYDYSIFTKDVYINNNY